MPTPPKTPAHKPAPKTPTADKAVDKPVSPHDGDIIMYAREDSGRLIPDHDLVLVPGEHLEVGLDVSVPLAKRLVETGHCRVLPAKKTEASPAKAPASQAAKRTDKASEPAAPTPTEVVQAEQAAVAEAEQAANTPA